jgi:ribosome-associated translation inhibitor RaiA
MGCWKKMQDIVNLINYEKSAIALSFILCLCLVGPGVLQTAYGQGTLVETVGTMEIGQQVDNGVNQSAPKRPADTKKPAQDTNNVTAPPNRAPGMQNRPSPAQTPPPDLQQQGQVPATVETTPAAPVVMADTNVPDVNDFNAFKQEIARIDIEARGEDTQWLGKQEKKAELAKAMGDVVVAELRFLRKVAAAANDTNTVEAIDLVLKKRQDRLNKLVTKLENELKEERRQQAGERQQRRAPRTGGVQQQGQTQTDRSAGGTSPLKRARDTVNQEP